MEKLLAGESRAVEHVALEDDETEQLLAAATKGRQSRKRRVTGESEHEPQLLTPPAKQRAGKRGPGH